MGVSNIAALKLKQGLEDGSTIFVDTLRFDGLSLVDHYHRNERLVENDRSTIEQDVDRDALVGHHLAAVLRLGGENDVASFLHTSGPPPSASSHASAWSTAGGKLLPP